MASGHNIVVSSIQLPAPGTSKVVCMAECKNDYSGITLEWLLNNSIIVRRPKRKKVAGRLEYGTNIFYFGVFVAVGPMDKLRIDRVSLVCDTVKRLFYPDNWYVTIPGLYVNDPNSGYFSIGNSAWEIGERVFYSQLDNNRKWLYPEDQDRVVTLNTFISTSSEEEFKLFYEMHMSKLIEQLCLLYILGVSGINTKTIWIRKEKVPYPFIVDVSGVASALPSNLVSIDKMSPTFYFDGEPYNTVAKKWNSRAPRLYRNIANSISSYDLSLSEHSFGDVSKRKNFCISILNYYNKDPTLEVEYSKTIEGGIDLDSMFDLEVFDNAVYGFEVGPNANAVIYETPISGIVAQAQITTTTRTTNPEMMGGMDDRGKYTYSHGSRLIPVSMDDVFTRNFMNKMLSYYIGKGDVEKALICGTEVFRVREYTSGGVKDTAEKSLSVNLIRTALRVISLRDVNVVSTVVKLLYIPTKTGTKEVISLPFGRMCSLVTIMCGSEKTNFYNEMNRVYSYDRILLANSGVYFFAFTSTSYNDARIEYETMMANPNLSEVQTLVRKAVNPKFPPSSDQMGKYMLSLFYALFISGEFSCLSWLHEYRKYYDEKQEIDGVNSKIHVIRRVDKNTGVEKNVDPNVLIFELIIDLFQNMETPDQVVLGYVNTFNTNDPLKFEIAVFMILWYMEGVPMASIIPVPDVDNELINSLRSGLYDPQVVLGEVSSVKLIQYKGKKSEKLEGNYDILHQLYNETPFTTRDRYALEKGMNIYRFIIKKLLLK